MGKSRLDQKIEETLQLTRRRRDRRLHPTIGMKAPHLTGDPFTARLFEHERFNETGVIMEQPMPVAAPPEGAPEQDVLVPPEGEMPVPGVDTPEEPEPEEPSKDDPETKLEEDKRALFNTLSELIDLGRVERNEADIRKYCEEHEDEVGDLLEVLDDVLEMLIMQADVTRTPETFDQDEDDDVESTPGQKDYDELKPGVGGQVPKGASYTSIISSELQELIGTRLTERVAAGEDFDTILDSPVREEVIQLTFKNEQDRDQAMERIEKVDVPSSNLMKVEATNLNIVRDDSNRADVDQQLAALDNLEFAQSVTEADWIGRIGSAAGKVIGLPMRAAGAVTKAAGAGASAAGRSLSGVDEEDPDGETAVEEPSAEDIAPMTELWQDVAFAQGEEATEVLDLIEADGPEAALDMLVEMGYTDLSGETSNDAPWGDNDEVYVDEATGLTLSWNSRLGYWGLSRKVEAAEFGANLDEAKKKYALIPSEREKECPHNLGAWSGRVPNTGTFKCKMCGTELDPKTKKAVGESVNEQVNISRAGLAVQVGFSNDAQAASAKGALLQYKGIDVVVEADDHTIVAFTTDTDPEEARNRVETILSNARIPIESTVEVFSDPIREAGEEPLDFRYGGADLLPTPLPVGHGISGADEDASGQPDLGRCPRCGKSINQSDIQAGKCKSCYKELPQATEKEEVAILGATEDEEDPDVPSGDPDNPFGRDFPGEIGGDTSKEYRGFPIWRYYVDAVIETLPVSDDVRIQLLSTPYGQQAYESMRLEEIWDTLSTDTKDAIAQAWSQDTGQPLTEAVGERCPHCGGAYQNDVCLSCKRIKQMPQKVDIDGTKRTRPRRESTKEQMGPVATPDEQKYLQPFHAPDTPATPPSIDDMGGDPIGEPVESDEVSPEMWRMDVPADPNEMDQLEGVLNSAQDEGLLARWTLVPAESEEPPVPDADIVSPEEDPSGDPLTMEQTEPIDDLPDVELPPASADVEPMPGDVGEFIVIEFSPETEQEEREMFAEFIADETSDEATGDPGITVTGYEQLGPEEGMGIGELEPGVEPPSEQIVPPTPDAALAHGPMEGEEGEEWYQAGTSKAPKMSWDEPTGQQPPELPAHLQKMLSDYQAAKKSDPNKAIQIAANLKFEIANLGGDPKEYGITEDEAGGEVPPKPEVPDDPFDKAYETPVRQTVGGVAEPAEEGCPAPGRRIRSKGRGRGRSRGKGKGPMGRPAKS